MSTDAPLLKVNVGNGQEITVYRIDELLDICRQEIEFWTWLRAPEVMQAGLGYPDKAILRIWEQVQQHGLDWEKSPSKAEAKGQVAGHLSSLGNAPVSSRNTPDGQIINQLRQALGNVSAAAAIQYLANHAFDIKKPEHLRGVIAFYAVKFGTSPLTNPANIALIETFVQNASAELERVRAERSSAAKEAAAQLTADKSAAEVTIASMKSEIREIQNSNQKLLEVLGAEFEKFKRFYKDGISLQGPVQYWNDKRARHRWYAGGAFALFVTYLFAAGVTTDYFIHQTRLGDLSFWKDAGYGVVAMVAVGVGIMIALGRIIVRLFMSQLHLGNDSDERVTMVKTYLALREGGHAESKHVEIVLARLFTPTADGIVRDDLGPITPIEALASRLAGKT